MKAMVLAAGRGERLRPLTDTLPKSLVEVRGESLLERHLRHIRSAGIDTVIVNLGWLGEKIVERIGTGERFGLDVRYSDERDGILDTGGGIYKALPLLGDEPFLVVNADIYTNMPVPEVTLAGDQLGHLVLVPMPHYSERGDFDLDEGLVRRGEVPAYTFSGIAVYRPEIFAGCKAGRFSLVPLMFAAADAGRLAGSLYRGAWADIGTPERLAALQSRRPRSAR